MKKQFFIILLLSTSVFAKTSWGKTGHRTIGEIASKHISKKTAKKINQLLQGKSLAMVSIYADEIRSDSAYDSFGPWHYVNFNGDKKYKEEPVNPHGDILTGIKTCILKIRDNKTTVQKKAFYLKMLVHFVGDLHMPLHAGNKDDKGGNSISLKWFYKPTNLHRLWDEDMIDFYQMSYSELATNLDINSKKKNQEFYNGTLIDWVHESRVIALDVYKSTQEGKNESYVYMYNNFPIVKQQLQKGGVRLAFILNEVFKPKSTWLNHFLDQI